MSDHVKLITSNRKARHDFSIEETFEAGIILQGTEVKSLRDGKANLQDAYCTVNGDEVYLLNLHINPYTHGNLFNHEPMRQRKLLLHRREIEKLEKATQQKGYTIVPLQLYFKNGKVKVEIGLARGKKLYDKRHDIAERDANRRMEQISKQYQ